MQRWKLQDTIRRIQQMELYFDTIQSALMADPHIVCEDVLICEMLRILIQYYENGQWLADYQCDERGQLPPELKRGVLSQDGVYNLLCEIDQLQKIDG